MKSESPVEEYIMFVLLPATKPEAQKQTESEVKDPSATSEALRLAVVRL